jgi:MFS family permease
MGGSYRDLLRKNRDFRNLWYGQIASLFGDWFNLIASASLVASLTGSGLAVGTLFAVRMLAPFLVSPLAGVAADRFDRRRLLIATDVVRAVVVLGFLFVRTSERVWLLYMLTAVQLGMHGFFFPTRNAILPDIVSQEELGAANAITSATWSVMLAFGAAAGGLVAGGWGVYPAFVVDSATFLVSAVFLARMSYRRPTDLSGSASLRAALDDYVEGLRYLARHGDVLVLTLHKAALTFFVAGAYEVVQVAISKDVFVIGEGGGIGLGVMYAAVGIGSGLGPFLGRAITGDRDRPLRVAIVFCYAAMAAGLLIVATLASLPWVLLGAMLRAMGGGTLWVFSTQLLLHSVPGRVRGRVFASEFAFLTVAMAASAALSGWALDQRSLEIASVLRLMAAGALVPGLSWAVWIATRRPAGSSC